MLELTRNALFYFTNLLTFDRFLTILEISVIAVAAVFAYRVGKKQNQINENLLGLHLAPSLLVTCKLNDEKMFIANKGVSTVYLCSIQGEGFEGEMVNPPRSLEPGVIFTMKIPSVIKIGRDKKEENEILVTVLLMSKDNKKYMLKTMFYFDFEDSELKEIRSQSYPLEVWLD